MEPEEWTSHLRAVRRGRQAGRLDELPTTRARPRRPARPRRVHGSARRAATEHEIEASAFPIVASEEGLRGDDLLLAARGERRRGGSAMKVKVWGARGSVPAPGPEMNRYGGNTSCVELTPRRRRGADPRRRHRHPQPRASTSPRGAEGQHPAHPPAPRPHPGPDVLPALLPPRVRDHDLGPGLARGLARGPDRPLHLRPALAGRGPRAALRRLVPRHAARASGRSARRRSAPRPSPTAARRSATGSPTATTTLCYIPDHEPGARRRRSTTSSRSGSPASTSPATPTC